jgi:hypothetical protein
MSNVLPAVKLTFSVYFICIHGPESHPMVRLLLVEAGSAQVIYDGLGTWSQCRRWIEQLSSDIMSEDQVAIIRKCLRRKRLAAIKEVTASLLDIESLGLCRVDNSESKSEFLRWREVFEPCPICSLSAQSVRG